MASEGSTGHDAVMQFETKQLQVSRRGNQIAWLAPLTCPCLVRHLGFTDTKLSVYVLSLSSLAGAASVS